MLDYVYNRLKPGEIRLLHLKAGEHADQLEGSIKSHLLTDPTYRKGEEDKPGYLEHSTPYNAISYAWGRDRDKPFDIVIDGASIVKLTAVLHDVLHRVRDPKDTLALWIDAICIEQADNNSTEKTEQIRLMPVIYRAAQRVQVHLGPEGDDSPLAIQLLEHIADYYEYLDDTLNVPATTAHTLAVAKGFSFPPPDDPKWNAVRKFWKRKWFRRIWVIQEFACALNVDIICGEETIDWRKLWLAAKAYIDNRTLISGGYTTISKEDLFKIYRKACEGAANFVTMADLRVRASGYMSLPCTLYRIGQEGIAANELHKAGLRKEGPAIPIPNDFQAIKFHEQLFSDFIMRSRAEGKAFPFHQEHILKLLYGTTSFKSSISVDRIYALLGLGCGADGPGFQIEYEEESVEQVCERFAKAFISNGMCSAVLAMAGASTQTSKSRKNIPSWVPDWTEFVHFNDRRVPMSNTALLQLSQESENYDDAELRTMSLRNYEAAKGSPTDIRFDDQGTLILKGSLVDTISRSWEGTFTGLPIFYEIMLRKYVQQYPTREPHAEVIWRTLILNQSRGGGNPPDEYANEYETLKGMGYLAMLITFGPPILGGLVVFCILRYLPFWTISGIVIALHARDSEKFTLNTCFKVCLLTEAPLWLAPFILTGILWFGGALAAVDWFFSVLKSISATNISGGSFNSTAPKWSAGYMRTLSILFTKYSFAVTENKYAGMFPVFAQPGDRVAIFHGCDVPYLLRPEMRDDKTFKLLGECYVHGIMQGEAFENEPGEISLI